MTHPQTGQITNMVPSRLLTCWGKTQSTQQYCYKFQTSVNLYLTIRPTLGNSSPFCRPWETRNLVCRSLIQRKPVSSSSSTTPPNRQLSWMPYYRYSGPCSCAWSSLQRPSTSSMMRTSSCSTPSRECLRRWDWSRGTLWQPLLMRCSRPVSFLWWPTRKRNGSKESRLRRRSRRRGRHSSRIRIRLTMSSSMRLRSSRRPSSRSGIFSHSDSERQDPRLLALISGPVVMSTPYCLGRRCKLYLVSATSATSPTPLRSSKPKLCCLWTKLQKSLTQ